MPIKRIRHGSLFNSQKERRLWVVCGFSLSSRPPKGKVDMYKVRLIGKGYNKTYGIDYDETFAHVANMGIVRTLISCAVNFGWALPNWM
jgi:hypothetical protein